jgi:hypothetical protein
MRKINYSGYRFPSEIIQHAIWVYFRFTLSFRDVEDLLAERGIIVSYDANSPPGCYAIDLSHGVLRARVHGPRRRKIADRW